MTATFQAAVGGGATPASGAQTATAVTGGGTANRFLAIIINIDRAGTVSSVQNNGNAMTAGPTFTNTAGGDSRMYYIAGDSNISTGSNTVTWTNDGFQGYSYVIGIWNGVDSVSPWSGGSFLSNGGSSAYNKVVTSATGDIAVALGYSGVSTVVVSSSGSTTLQYQTATTGTAHKVYVEDRPGAASAQIDIQYDGAASINIAVGSVKSATSGSVGKLMMLGMG